MFLEPKDFIGLLIMAVILIIPLVSIYLTLKTLKWNEGKKLFSTSWALFFVWIFSGLFAVLICAVVADNLSVFQDKTFFVLLIISLLIVNTVSIAGILNFTNDKSEENLLSIESNNNNKNYRAEYKKIFKVSAIVSVITLAVFSSLIFFLIDIDSKVKIPHFQDDNVYID